MNIEKNRSYTPKYWNTSKGRVLLEVLVKGTYAKSNLIKKTGLDEKQLETVLDDLVQLELINHNDDYSRFWSNSRELSIQYNDFYERNRVKIIEKFHEWKYEKWKNSDLNHFFVEDDLLDELAEVLIKEANREVLVINPFVDRCHLSNTLIRAVENGIDVKLITSSPQSNRYNPYRREQYHVKLKDKGVSIIYDDLIHPKIIVVDRSIAIISSMNFLASSSGGGSYEAGLVTIEPEVVKKICSSIEKRL